MATNFLQQTVRLPRHPILDESEYSLLVECKPQQLSAQLIDLSRNGAQFCCDQEFDEGQPIALHLVVESSDLDVTLPGKVRWQHCEEDDLYSIGCEFDEEIDWETLGELFLSGVLSTDLPADQLPLP